MENVMERIAKQSWGHGLNFELAGRFKDENELKKLLNSYDINSDNSEDLVNESVGYALIYGENIDTVQVENDNELWIVYHDLSTFDGLCDALYKDQNGDYLLGFAYDTFNIRFAIDLKTGTIGTINFKGLSAVDYRWKHTLYNDDIKMLQSVVEENDLSIDGDIQVNRLDMNKLAYPVI